MCMIQFVPLTGDDGKIVPDWCGSLVKVGEGMFWNSQEVDQYMTLGHIPTENAGLVEKMQISHTAGYQVQPFVDDCVAQA